MAKLITTELKYRIIGIIVIFGLLIIFVPIIFDRPNELRPVEVSVPRQPHPKIIKAKDATQTQIPHQIKQNAEDNSSVINSEQLDLEPNNVIGDNANEIEQQQIQDKEKKETIAETKIENKSINLPKKQVKKETKKQAKPKLDANGLPITWSVQVVSLSNREGAVKLQQDLRKQGYNAYVRTNNKMYRVLVGPVIEYSEAQKILNQINKQHNLQGLIVRFEPNS